MAVPKKVLNFIEKSGAKYEILDHKVVYTAFDKAKTLRVPENTIGKTLIVKTGKEFSIALIPSNKNLDEGKFIKLINTNRKKKDKPLVKNVGFATEQWMKNNIKGVKIGSIPPFGNLWKMPMFIDKDLAKVKNIIVSSGDYGSSFRIDLSDLNRLASDFVFGSVGKVKKKKLRKIKREQRKTITKKRNKKLGQTKRTKKRKVGKKRRAKKRSKKSNIKKNNK